MIVELGKVSEETKGPYSRGGDGGALGHQNP
jgi:hypothetical protein